MSHRISSSLSISHSPFASSSILSSAAALAIASSICLEDTYGGKNESTYNFAVDAVEHDSHLIRTITAASEIENSETNEIDEI